METSKILIVDDNPDNVDRIIDLLNETEKKFMFYQALNGKVACMIAEKKLPDLIISDWDMPVMDGIELIKCLKSVESTKDIPVIMYTGVMTENEHLKTALDSGAVDYIRKPVEKLELTARVHSMLKLSDSIKKIKEQNCALLQQKKEITTNKEEIEEKNNKLQELNATKDKFFSIIAHDLKNPFHGILELSDLVLNTETKVSLEELTQCLELINATAKSTYKLLENLLEWSLAQTGRIEFNPDSINLSGLAIDVITLTENSAKAKNITIENQILNGLTVFADPYMLYTILRNLIANAIKFTNKDGKIYIWALQKDDEVEVTVSDNGIGISEKMKDKLFKVSEKVTTAGTENENGTGLGLILCKEFVEKHKGKIWVESTQGKGSDFKFSLPLYNN